MPQLRILWIALLLTIALPAQAQQSLTYGESVTGEITDQRIIRYSPSALGLHKEIEDYRYEDIANLKVDKGIMFATITARRRFMSQDLVLDKLSKENADYISKVIQENLRRLSGATPSPTIIGQQSPPTALEDPLQVLKLRFARGEITKEQFEEMKSALD